MDGYRFCFSIAKKKMIFGTKRHAQFLATRFLDFPLLRIVKVTGVPVKLSASMIGGAIDEYQVHFGGFARTFLHNGFGTSIDGGILKRIHFP